MRTAQLVRFAVGGLWRQKVRTTLTLIGVTVGTAALVFSLSLGMGLRSFVENEFKSRDDFWRVTVQSKTPSPDQEQIPPEKIAVPGDISDARKARIREALIEKHLNSAPLVKSAAQLTPDTVTTITAMPDVLAVNTFRVTDGRLSYGDKTATALVAAGNLSGLAERLAAGRLPSDDANEMLVSEFLLYELGVRSEAEFDAMVGKSLPLEVGGVRNTQQISLARALMGRMPNGELSRGQLQALDKLTAALPKALDSFDLTPAERQGLKTLLDTKPETSERPWESSATERGEFTVSGVVRLTTREEQQKAGPFTSWELRRGEIFLSPNRGGRFLEQLPWMKDVSYPSVEVRVKPGGDLPGVVANVEAMGFQTYSSLKWFTNAKREVTMIAGGLNLFALVALFVAGIGITNTLVTSVVERTREIGILKAIGATRSQVQGIFLMEGTAIGLTGAMIGLALARVLAFPADKWVHSLIQKQTNGEKLVTETIFIFPWWLWVGAIVFAVVVTTASAYYPARRAAKIQPVEALKYE